MSEPAIRLRGLQKRFGDTAAVDGLDLDVRRGEILGFVGPNGAGKTTSIRIVAGLTRPTRGHVEVLGTMGTPGGRAARRLIGLCPQDNVLYPELTAEENLRYVGLLYGVGRAQRRARATHLLTVLGLAQKSRARAGKLSGGMKRRLSLAMALVHDPPVVILDEPEAGLDPQTRLAVREFIRGMRREKTVLLTSHNMDEVDRLADRVAFVDKGRLVALGTTDELKRQIGDGDVVEITLQGDHAQVVGKALLDPHVRVRTPDARTVVVAGRDLARHFPQLIARVAATGAVIADVRYRGNTLEDVFIALTGRGLRE